jgi:hypothetical protein
MDPSEERRAQHPSGGAINRLFTPQFRNRLDATIPFAHLSQSGGAVRVTSSPTRMASRSWDRLFYEPSKIKGWKKDDYASTTYAIIFIIRLA